VGWRESDGARVRVCTPSHTEIRDPGAKCGGSVFVRALTIPAGEPLTHLSIAW
jgi:hypothetical protein